MPPRRKLPKKKRNTNKRWKIYGKAGWQLANDVLYLKSVINSELHQLENTIATNLSVPSTGGMVHLSPVGQGDASYQRSGISILPKYLNARLILEQNIADTYSSARLIFFMWKDSSTPVIADILENTTVTSHYNHYNKAGSKRDRDFQILSDTTYALTNKGDTHYKNIKIDMPMNPVGNKYPVHIRYDGSATTAEMNGLYLAYVSNQLNDYPRLNGEVVFRFYDN